MSNERATPYSHLGNALNQIMPESKTRLRREASAPAFEYLLISALLIALTACSAIKVPDAVLLSRYKSIATGMASAMSSIFLLERSLSMWSKA